MRGKSCRYGPAGSFIELVSRANAARGSGGLHDLENGEHDDFAPRDDFERSRRRGIEFGACIGPPLACASGNGLSAAVDVGASTIQFQFFGFTAGAGPGSFSFLISNIDETILGVTGGPLLGFGTGSTFGLTSFTAHSVLFTGSTASDYDAIGGRSVTFNVTAADPAAPVPEPSSLALLGIGIAAPGSLVPQEVFCSPFDDPELITESSPGTLRLESQAKRRPSKKRFVFDWRYASTSAYRRSNGVAAPFDRCAAKKTSPSRKRRQQPGDDHGAVPPGRGRGVRRGPSRVAALLHVDEA
jgi:hypothetical protein